MAAVMRETEVNEIRYSSSLQRWPHRAAIATCHDGSSKDTNQNNDKRNGNNNNNDDDNNSSSNSNNGNHIRVQLRKEQRLLSRHGVVPEIVDAASFSPFFPESFSTRWFTSFFLSPMR